MTLDTSQLKPSLLSAQKFRGDLLFIFRSKKNKSPQIKIKFALLCVYLATLIKNNMNKFILYQNAVLKLDYHFIYLPGQQDGGVVDSSKVVR